MTKYCECCKYYYYVRDNKCWCRLGIKELKPNTLNNACEQFKFLIGGKKRNECFMCIYASTSRLFDKTLIYCNKHKDYFANCAPACSDFRIPEDKKEAL